MSNPYQIFLISDSTGETLDRIFLALKAQFKNFSYEVVLLSNKLNFDGISFSDEMRKVKWYLIFFKIVIKLYIRFPKTNGCKNSN